MFSRDLTELLVLATVEEMETQIEHQTTAYAITKKIKQKFGDIWNASPGTVYPMLDKLVDLGDLTAQNINEQGQTIKKIYKISEQGKNRLKESSSEFIQSAIKAFPNLFLGFKKFFPFGAFRFEIPKHFDFDEWILDSQDFDDEIPTSSRIETLLQEKQRLEELKQNYQERIRKIEEKISEIESKIIALKEIREKEWIKVPIRDYLEEE